MSKSKRKDQFNAITEQTGTANIFGAAEANDSGDEMVPIKEPIVRVHHEEKPVVEPIAPVTPVETHVPDVKPVEPVVPVTKEPEKVSNTAPDLPASNKIDPNIVQGATVVLDPNKDYTYGNNYKLSKAAKEILYMVKWVYPDGILSISSLPPHVLALKVNAEDVTVL